MDVKVSYKVTNTAGLLKQILPEILPKVEALVTAEIDAYLDDVAAHMGLVYGGSDYTDGRIKWEALDTETLERSPRFWYDSGQAKQAVTVGMQVTDNGIQAFVGIASTSSAYDQALWNELGFTPHNSDHLIRRPLFLPLADEHKSALQEKMKRALSRMTINISVG